MQFSDKLNFLMDITKTTNSALSLHSNVDASYISRLRRGKRLLPKNEDCVRSMASYFSKRCTKDYQQKAVCDVLNLSSFPHESSILADVISQWLLAKMESEEERMENFFKKLSFTPKRIVPSGDILQKVALEFSRKAIDVYYGIEGKRQSVQYFLSEVIARDKPQTLLLFSDEETSWMTGDTSFAQNWYLLMINALARGNRIKIIHTISRDLDEMLNAISQWMPLYMSGLIEPYFYPKKRDGIFRRTLFIAPETAAVVSSSVGNMTKQAANLIFREQDAIASFTDEFSQYFNLCRPLMRIFTGKNRDAYRIILEEFEKYPSDTLIKTESLSILTMPNNLLMKITERACITDTTLLEYHRLRVKSFRQNITRSDFTEIITLPEFEALEEGRIKIALSDMLIDSTMYYTPEDYIHHLENIIELLSDYDNYHVHILKEQTENQYAIYARDELGAIVSKNYLPPVALTINESNMTAAFWDFLKVIVGLKAYENPDNQECVHRLQNYIGMLRKCMY